MSAPSSFFDRLWDLLTLGRGGPADGPVPWLVLGVAAVLLLLLAVLVFRWLWRPVAAHRGETPDRPGGGSAS
jgi:hypothetical protein